MCTQRALSGTIPVFTQRALSDTIPLSTPRALSETNCLDTPLYTFLLQVECVDLLV